VSSRPDRPRPFHPARWRAWCGPAWAYASRR
jgi:hypothetical protein